MTTPSADGERTPPPPRNIFSIIAIALVGAVVGAFIAPMITFFAAMILAGLTTDCANDSGGCAMWAGSAAIASIPVGAALMFALGLYSGLTSR